MYPDKSFHFLSAKHYSVAYFSEQRVTQSRSSGTQNWISNEVSRRNSIKVMFVEDVEQQLLFLSCSYYGVSAQSLLLHLFQLSYFPQWHHLSLILARPCWLRLTDYRRRMREMLRDWLMFTTFCLRRWNLVRFMIHITQIWLSQRTALSRDWLWDWLWGCWKGGGRHHVLGQLH